MFDVIKSAVAIFLLTMLFLVPTFSVMYMIGWIPYSGVMFLVSPIGLLLIAIVALLYAIMDRVALRDESVL